MDRVTFSRASQDYIDNYDNYNHKVWNTTKGMVAKIRKEVRNHYKIQQRYLCCYCRQQTLQDHGFVWDCEHILPKAIYPKFLFEPLNLALSCKACNLAKEKYKHELIISEKDQYCENSNNYRIIHPHFDLYNKHLTVKTIDGTTVHEVNSEKGTFTYKCCDLKRFDKKLAGYDTINDDVALTVSNLLNSGMDAKQVVEALRNKKVAIERNTDFA
ncbi:conserved hypothetical protein [Vibrio chagasii]|nr:conserved hypothetical protein [Vibrio chagasii]CAH6892683.1 conserved hypothetical protein [Vibrio chagasii]CAH6907393.1 conserved hypothetical protein [Vibrio chagasii]CAH6954217.1 conserved hypothetical protein [Vibrio chagasii]CAH6992573.1 conserved hypothetical protein [Vibrio chagasii]